MIKNKKEFKQIVAQILRTDENTLTEIPMHISDSMTGDIEDGFDGSIFCFCNINTGKKYVAKIKGSSYVKNVCDVMNTKNSSEFRRFFEKGAPAFNIIDSFVREKNIYEGVTGFTSDFFPQYYGSWYSDDTCVFVIEYLDICQDNLDFSAIANFLAGLHNQFLGMDALMDSFRVSKTHADDFREMRKIDRIIFDEIAKGYIDFPDKALKAIREFYEEPDIIYKQLTQNERTLCHGDFSVKNISFTANKLIVYDWELATFNHPEFDLVTFFVLFPKLINSTFIDLFTDLYLKQCEKRPRLHTNMEKFKDLMAFNTKLYMVTRFHEMMIICRSVSMPYMKVAIKNWLTLFNHYC